MLGGGALFGCNWTGQQRTVGHGPKIEADENIGLHTAGVCLDIHPTIRWLVVAVLAMLADEKIVPYNNSLDNSAVGDENVKLDRVGSD